MCAKSNPPLINLETGAVAGTAILQYRTTTVQRNRRVNRSGCRATATTVLCPHFFFFFMPFLFYTLMHVPPSPVNLQRSPRSGPALEDLACHEQRWARSELMLNSLKTCFVSVIYLNSLRSVHG